MIGPTEVSRNLATSFLAPMNQFSLTPSRESSSFPALANPIVHRVQTEASYLSKAATPKGVAGPPACSSVFTPIT